MNDEPTSQDFNFFNSKIEEEKKGKSNICFFLAYLHFTFSAYSQNRMPSGQWKILNYKKLTFKYLDQRNK